MIRIVAQTPTAQLCCYPRNSWAVFIYKPDANGDWKCIKNGKLADILEKWNEIASNGN